MIDVVTLATPELGDHTYLLHDGQVAVVVDPQRDIERVLAAAARAAVRIRYVAETHIHNDYVSGGRALAELLDVPYLVPAPEEVSFRRLGVADGDEVVVGRRFRLKVFATPGHTLHHVAYVALDDRQPVMVCSGGSLLYGSTGRTDLSGPEWAAPLARAQFHSARRLGELANEVLLLPTHGFGSLCAPLGGQPPAGRSSIGEERARNLAFIAPDEETFSRALLAALAPYPRYYVHMGDLNRVGVGLADAAPPPSVDGSELIRFLRQGGWAVDLRPRRAFAMAHLAGTVSIEYGRAFTTCAGSVVPWASPLILMADSEDTVAAAQRDLSRIGMDRVVGQMIGPVAGRAGASAADGAGASAADGAGAWAAEMAATTTTTWPTQGNRLPVSCYPIADRAELLAIGHSPSAVVLDVRRLDEWQSDHLAGAVHIPLADLNARMDDLPGGTGGTSGTIWVHCAAGYRAGIAASLLARAGRRVVLVDDEVVPASRPAAA